MKQRIKAILLASLTLAACKVEPPKPQLVQTIAILPFNNGSNDLNAAEIMQKLVYSTMKLSAYQTMDIAITNKKLADVGIIDGGQLPALDPKKMGQDFGVQALMYGSVESFDYTNVGYYMSRKVEINLQVVDVGTGQILWENTGTGATRRVAFNSEDAKANLTRGIAEQLADKAFKNPLAEESRLATLNALRKLPGYVYHGFADDPNGGGKLGVQNAVKSIFIDKGRK